VVTCGAEGGVLASADSTWRFPALKVQVIDTTGCGDAFSAGYLFGLSEGLEPSASCGWGTCAAAMVAQVLGSDGVTDAAAVRALLREQWAPAVAGSA
jgi:sugar/nucleoside kinase (ribokinase family)